MNQKSVFEALSRNSFRECFQPSRILLGIVPAPTESGVNIITLCFSMHCSYRPPMMAIAVHKRAATHGLLQRAEEFVLAVPGPSLLEATIVCGTRSLRQLDKVKELNLELIPSKTVKVPSLRGAIANIELVKEEVLNSGDHLIVIGVVKQFGVDRSSRELPLLSIGPRTTGYRLLKKHGIHRIGIVG